ncbi:MAG: 6-phosphogluconolactonase [Gaiellales bacterium]
MAEHAAGWIGDRAIDSGPFRIALTGGSKVGAVYERLADKELDWGAWHVWWSDERDVPPDHEDSNERLARETLLSKVPIPEEQIHPLRSTDAELPPRFDLILLGIGPDGHTASLYPGHDAELEVTDPVIYVPEPGWPPPHPRYTFTFPLINSASAAAFIVGGEEKREILARVFTGDPSLPAARVHAPLTVILADEAAAPPR